MPTPLLRRSFVDEVRALANYLPRGDVWKLKLFEEGGEFAEGFVVAQHGADLLIPQHGTRFRAPNGQEFEVIDGGVPEILSRTILNACEVSMFDVPAGIAIAQHSVGLYPNPGTGHDNIPIIQLASDPRYESPTDVNFVEGTVRPAYTFQTGFPGEDPGTIPGVLVGANSISEFRIRSLDRDENANLPVNTPLTLLSEPGVSQLILSAVVSWDDSDGDLHGPLTGGARPTRSNLHLLLRGLAYEMQRVDDLLDVFRSEYPPSRTRMLIAEWEEALGIPDGCFTGTGTIEERRRDILTKLAALGVQTADDFETLAAVFGLTITVAGGTDHPELTYPGGTKEQNHTIVISIFDDAVRGFDYGVGLDPGFPIPFQDQRNSTIQCLLNKLKPANTNIRYLYFPTA